MRVFSYGGGVQSTAVMVLIAEGKLQYDHVVFANVGDDSENPRTLEYIRDIARPYMAEHGINFVEVQKRNRKGEPVTLRNSIMNNDGRIPIPAWLPSGAFGYRNCTVDFKLKIVAKLLKQNGATPDDPATVGLGISTDEWTRARNDSGITWERLEYPLLDLMFSRRDCMWIINGAGLPQPPKSSCYFCPFHRQSAWEELRRDEPDLFDKAVEIDYHIREKRAELGKDGMYLHYRRIPLDKAIGLQMVFDFNENDLPCDSGYCFL